MSSKTCRQRLVVKDLSSKTYRQRLVIKDLSSKTCHQRLAIISNMTHAHLCRLFNKLKMILPENGGGVLSLSRAINAPDGINEIHGQP